MFQKSLLKNFSKSFNAPDQSKIIKLLTKEKFIAEDANGAEFISLLSEFLNWTHCSREVKNSTDMKKADGVVYTDLDLAGGWKNTVLNELRTCGYEVKVNG